MATKRKDKSRVVLKTGEVQRKDGTYQFSWQDSQMKRRFVYARTLDDLREKEKRIQKDKCDGIKTEARYTTIDELFDLWANMKRGLKNNTFENYKYMYNTFVRPVIGSKRISTLKKSDIKKYYNYLVDERNLKPSTIDNIHEDAKKFVRYSDGAKMYSMGMTKFQEVAKDAKACYKIGQLVLVNTEILDKYLETFHITDSEFYK